MPSRLLRPHSPFRLRSLVLWAVCVLAAGGTAPAAQPLLPLSPGAPAPAITLPPEDDSPLGKAYRDAFVSFKRGDDAAADTACDRALRIAPKDPPTLVLKGRIAAAQGDSARAEALLKQGLALDVKPAAAHRALGEFYFRQRRYAEGRLELLDAQRRGDADKDLSLLILYCDVGLKDLGEAERVQAGFNAFDETTPAYYFGKAAVLSLKNDPAGSKQSLQDATVLYGTDVFARYAANYFFLFATKG